MDTTRVQIPPVALRVVDPMAKILAFQARNPCSTHGPRIMVRKVVCDGCGAEVTDDEGLGHYNVGRYGEDYSENGDICEDCLPDEVEDILHTEEY